MKDIILLRFTPAAVCRDGSVFELLNFDSHRIFLILNNENFILHRSKELKTENLIIFAIIKEVPKRSVSQNR